MKITIEIPDDLYNELRDDICVMTGFKPGGETTPDQWIAKLATQSTNQLFIRTAGVKASKVAQETVTTRLQAKLP